MVLPPVLCRQPQTREPLQAVPQSLCYSVCHKVFFLCLLGILCVPQFVLCTPWCVSQGLQEYRTTGQGLQHHSGVPASWVTMRQTAGTLWV